MTYYVMYTERGHRRHPLPTRHIFYGITDCIRVVLYSLRRKVCHATDLSRVREENTQRIIVGRATILFRDTCGAQPVHRIDVDTPRRYCRGTAAVF